MILANESGSNLAQTKAQAQAQACVEIAWTKTKTETEPKTDKLRVASWTIVRKESYFQELGLAPVLERSKRRRDFDLNESERKRSMKRLDWPLHLLLWPRQEVARANFAILTFYLSQGSDQWKVESSFSRAAGKSLVWLNLWRLRNWKPLIGLAAAS